MDDLADYRWDNATHTWRDTEGNIVPWEVVLAALWAYIAAAEVEVAALNHQLLVGEITIAAWMDAFEAMLADLYGDLFVLGAGGILPPEDYTQSLVELLSIQHEYILDRLLPLIEAPLPPTPAMLDYRCGNFLRSAQQAFWVAREAVARVTLPAHPGDCSTVCCCITSPQSNVLTSEGWKPIADVQVGDLVLTHRNRWRRVQHTVVKPSRPEHQQVWIKGPTGELVGCTDTHRWLTDAGWLDSRGIDSSDFLVYHLPEDYLTEVIHGQEDMCSVWETTVQQEQARQVSGVPVSLSLRGNEGLPSTGVPILRDESEGQEAMGFQEGENGVLHSAGGPEAAEAVRRYFGGYALGGQKKRSSLDVVSGRGGCEAHCLPVSLEMAAGIRSSAGGLCTASQRQKPGQRRTRQPRVDDLSGSRIAAWSDTQGQEAAVDMPTVRTDIHQKEVQEQIAQVLFSGLLPPSTPLYDIVVEEDHSYIIEGLISHNTNCHCWWRVEWDDEGGWAAYWELLSGLENCPDCTERHATWFPWVPPEAPRPEV